MADLIGAEYIGDFAPLYLAQSREIWPYERAIWGLSTGCAPICST